MVMPGLGCMAQAMDVLHDWDCISPMASIDATVAYMIFSDSSHLPSTQYMGMGCPALQPLPILWPRTTLASSILGKYMLSAVMAARNYNRPGPSISGNGRDSRQGTGTDTCKKRHRRRGEHIRNCARCRRRVYVDIL